MPKKSKIIEFPHLRALLEQDDANRAENAAGKQASDSAPEPEGEKKSIWQELRDIELPTALQSKEVMLCTVAVLSFLQENGFAEDSIDGQLWFFKTEIESSERTAWNAIKDLPNTSDGAYEAGRLWCLKFERPRDGVGDSVERGNLAQNTYWPAYGGR